MPAPLLELEQPPSADATDFSDVQLELAPEEALSAEGPSAVADTETEPESAAAAPKSIWKMLSFRPAKPAKDSTALAEAAVQIPQDVSSQLSPAVDARPSSISLRSRHGVDQGEHTDSSQPGPVAAAPPELQQGDDLPQQPIAAAKHFGFFSSLRRNISSAAIATARTDAPVLDTVLPPETMESASSSAHTSRHMPPVRLPSQAAFQQQPSLPVQQQQLQSAVKAVVASSQIQLPPVFDYNDGDDVHPRQQSTVSASLS